MILMVIFAGVLLPFTIIKNQITRVQGAILFAAYIFFIFSLAPLF